MGWALPFGYFGLAIMAMTWTMLSGGTVEFSGLLVLVVEDSFVTSLKYVKVFI